MHGAADRASALPNTRRVISLPSGHKDSDYLLLLLLLLLFIIILCSRGCALSDVDVTSLGIFLRKRVEEPTRRFVWTLDIVDLFKKKLKKKEMKNLL